MSQGSFTHVVANETELRELYRMPSELVAQKQRPSLDQHDRAWIEASPFVLIGTTSPDSTGDVSPKGGTPGFVVVLDDHRLAIPDLSGNNLDGLLTLAECGLQLPRLRRLDGGQQSSPDQRGGQNRTGENSARPVFAFRWVNSGRVERFHIGLWPCVWSRL